MSTGYQIKNQEGAPVPPTINPIGFSYLVVPNTNINTTPNVLPIIIMPAIDQVGYTIEMNRIAESPKSTVSEFFAYGPIPLRPVSGYILEPGGPSTTARNQDRRVPSGIYYITPYSSTNHQNVYRISNFRVPLDRNILIHIGNYHSNTLGCLLPGSSYSMVSGNYAVWHSETTLNQLRDLLITNNATLIIW